MKNRVIRIINTIFVSIDSFIWLCFSLVIALGMHPALPDNPALKRVMAVLSLTTCIAMPLLLFLSRKYNKKWFIPLLLGLGAVIFLTLTDQFGLPDFIVLILHIIPFAGIILEMRLRTTID